MPDFIGRPARRFGPKAQRRLMLGRAGKNSVGLVKMLSYNRCLDLASGFIELFQLQNTLERKAPQAVRTVTQGVEIPAIAIAGQALGRNSPFADVIAAPAVIGNEQTTAPEQGRHDILKQCDRYRPPGVTANKIGRASCRERVERRAG